MSDELAVRIFIVIGAVLIVWFLAGNELMRRRARRLAVWAKRGVDPLGGKQSILWLTLHSFRLEVEGVRGPVKEVKVTGLTEAWDVPINWLWNRLHGRRDMALVLITLEQAPPLPFELYRPGSLVASDSQHHAKMEGWGDEPLDEFHLAAPAGGAVSLASQLLAAVGPDRDRLLRLATRRQAPHLTVGLSLPDTDRLPPTQLTRLIERLAASLAKGR